MAGIVLARTDIALFSDPEATRVVIPRLLSHVPTLAYDQALVQFEGDEQPTPFRGEGKPRTHQLVAQYRRGEHQQMADLIALFEAAQAAPDPRLLLRPHGFEVADLNPIEVVTVAEVTRSPSGYLAWDLSFTATAVAYTVEV